MKKLILFYIFFTILFFGCDNSNSDATSNYFPLNDSESAALSLAADNILFEKPGYTLKADILEIDLISKDIKIFMNKKETKVIATSEIK